MVNGKESVYPTPIAGGDCSVVDAYSASNVSKFEAGLTKREYFAAIILQGLVSNKVNLHYPAGVVKTALEYTDELLKQL